MVLQTFAERATEWLVLAALVFGPGVAATVCWAPFLASRRIRALFRHLPPFGSTYPTYAFVAVVASFPYVLGLGIVLANVDTEGMRAGARMGNAILDIVVPLSLAYAVGVPLVGVLGLPRAGVDWDPHGYGLSTWAILFAGGVWYAALFAVPLTVVSLIVSFPG